MQETEWDILRVLWRRGEATARDVTDELAESRGWAMSTVRTMLERMRDKELVHGRRVGKTWVYAPAHAEVDAQRSAWQRFTDTVFDGTAGALRFLAQDAKLTKRQRERLRALLDEEGDDV